jgi:hypothetical protein
MFIKQRKLLNVFPNVLYVSVFEQNFSNRWIDIDIPKQPFNREWVTSAVDPLY